AEMYEFIDSCRLDDATYAYPVKKMCAWLSVSSSGFFAWRNRPKSATANRRDRLAALIRQAFTDSDETYGYRRIHAQLARQGVPCGPELVRGIMRELDLQPCQPRPWRVNLTEADGREHRIPDLLGQDFTADAPGQKTVGDITYIPTWEGWLYLATVIDCCTKMVVGYAMGEDYKTPLIQTALRNAADRGALAPDAIFHSDRGSNYTSYEFAGTITELDLRHSVGRTGICYDNAMAESFFAALKNDSAIAPSIPPGSTPAEAWLGTSNCGTISVGSTRVSAIRRHKRSSTSGRTRRTQRRINKSGGPKTAGQINADLDHCIPYPTGPTSEHNLYGGCPHHHSLKHHAG
ncbi:MAG: IS3 family transposase, partial [Pseudonocardia sp.]